MNPFMGALSLACAKAGIIPKEVPADGRWHSADLADDPHGKGDGRIKLFADGEGGQVQNWKSGSGPQSFFVDSGLVLNQTQQRERDKRREEAIQLARDEEARRHAEAATEAARIWKAATPAPVDHAYLARKGVQAHGLKVHNGALVVPMTDEAGTLHSLQFIDPEGGKRFLTGGRVKGCYHTVGGNPATAGTLCIVEGFATGASVHEETEYSVVVAFNAGNLEPVALSLRAQFPEVKLILCADDDYRTTGNPGLTKATEAAMAVGGFLAVPDFGPDRPEGSTDFNDLAQIRRKGQP